MCYPHVPFVVDTWWIIIRYIWAVLLASSSAGLWSERTNWGAAVSSPLVTMLLTITLCNVGVLPAASPVYNTINQVCSGMCICGCMCMLACRRPVSAVSLLVHHPSLTPHAWKMALADANVRGKVVTHVAHTKYDDTSGRRLRVVLSVSGIRAAGCSSASLRCRPTEGAQVTTLVLSVFEAIVVVRGR